MDIKQEIQEKLDSIFENFEFDNQTDEKIALAHNILHQYEENKLIKYYDIDYQSDDFIGICITPIEDSELLFLIIENEK